METTGTADEDLEHIKSCHTGLGADKLVHRLIQVFL